MRSRSLFLLSVLLLAIGGLVPLWANSVTVTNFSSNGSQYPGIIVDGTTIPYCQQSSSSSASCMTSFSGHGSGYGYIDSSGSISASAAFGSLKGGMTEERADGYLVASFGDNVAVTGGSGAGTLVAHYSLLSEGEAQDPGLASFSFVQGGTRTSVTANYVVNIGPPGTPAGPNCESIGFCFSESFDVSSPMQFGADLPLGAQMYVTSPSGTLVPPYGDVTASSRVDLTGYTVLNAGGNVISDAAVTPQNVPGLDLFPAPEPGTWALMLGGLAALGMWRVRRRRGLLLSLVGLVAVGGAVPVFADSVFVSNESLRSLPGLGQFTGTFYCQQYGISSASCQTGSSSRGGIGSIDSGGYVSASASFGKVNGGVTEGHSEGRLVASFSDDVVVTGGAGSGTLISHYALVNEGEAMEGPPAEYVFVQGPIKNGVVPDYTLFGGTPVPSAPPGCQRVGFCFSETFDVSSPIAFGVALPFGAEAYMGTPGGSLIGGRNSDVTGYISLDLTGYTVLDAAGNVVSDAAVTRQNVPGLNLDFTPEPGTWALMLAGFGALGARMRFRRNRPSA